MHILQPIATEHSITIVPRFYVYSSEDLDLYFERVVLDGGTLEGAACVQAELNFLDGLTVYITNENTNVTTEVSPTVTELNGYMILSSVYSVAEGTFYTITVKFGTTDIYRGKLYCTAQTDYEKYTVNQGAYTTENTHDNEFIVL